MVKGMLYWAFLTLFYTILVGDAPQVVERSFLYQRKFYIDLFINSMTANLHLQLMDVLMSKEKNYEKTDVYPLYCLV